MARNKRSTPSLSTAELIGQKEQEIAEYNRQIADAKAKIKLAENELVQLGEKQKMEKLTDLAGIAEGAGLSVDDVLRAFKDGTILSLIEKSVENKNNIAATSTPSQTNTSAVSSNTNSASAPKSWNTYN